VIETSGTDPIFRKEFGMYIIMAYLFPFPCGARLHEVPDLDCLVIGDREQLIRRSIYQSEAHVRLVSGECREWLQFLRMENIHERTSLITLTTAAAYQSLELRDEIE